MTEWRMTQPFFEWHGTCEYYCRPLINVEDSDEVLVLTLFVTACACQGLKPKILCYASSMSNGSVMCLIAVGPRLLKILSRWY
jgi:hypothetical protein